MYVSNTVAGRIHDLKLAQELDIRKESVIYADKGFVGLKLQPVRIKIPHKSSKKKILTEQQIAENKELNKLRVIIENVFAHLKVLRIIKDQCRNYSFGYRENIIHLAVKCYNFRIKKSS